MSEVKNITVQSVFDKFAVELDGKVVMFDTEAEAYNAAVMAQCDAEFTARADAFTAHMGLEGKNAAAKARIVKEFLAFEATPKDEVEAADEAAE